MKKFDKSKYKYQEFFCEENIWWLGKSLHEEGMALENQYVLIFSNDKKVTPMLYQGERLVVWDYHVVLYCQEEAIIFDFNSSLPFPCGVKRYFSRSFSPQLPIEYQVYVRKIAMTEYHENFYSDRSHMLNKNGTPVKDFPDWPAILHRGKKGVCLKEYIDFSGNPTDIVTADLFIAQCGFTSISAKKPRQKSS